MPLSCHLLRLRTVSCEPETDQENQDKSRQNQPGDHNDFDSYFADGRNVIVDIWVAIKESVPIPKDIRAT
jgi:hypothetical protein